MKRLYKRVLAGVLTAVMLIAAMPAAGAARFKDISGHWAKNDIEYAAEKGWFNGVSETEFQPEGTMTRGMFVKALGNLSGANISKYSGHTKFTDVNPSRYYAPYVNWAYQNGIVNGTSSTTFSPNAAITREQIAVMMVNYANYAQMVLPRERAWKAFSDMNSCADYSLDAVLTLYRADVINGMTTSKFSPKESATRAQCAAIFCRLYQQLRTKTTRAQQIDIINHRGYNTEAGENTMAAFQLTKAYGYDYCETDVQFTKDGVPVLIHDSSIDRTSNGSGKVAALTYAQLQQYDFSNGYKGTNGSIATFDEFMKYCSENGLHPYVELKTTVTAKQASDLVDIARNYNMLNNIIWISFIKESLLQIRRILPSATLGYLTNGATDNTIAEAVSLQNGKNTVMFQVRYTGITAKQRATLIRKGLPLTVWTVNDIKNCVQFANSSAVGITTDWVRYANLYS